MGWSAFSRDDFKFQQTTNGEWQGAGTLAQQPIFHDFNGDGKTDIATFDNDATGLRVGLSTGTSFDGAGSGIWGGWNPSNSLAYTPKVCQSKQKELRATK
jgi:hypothetical protein